jgi:hypothetical protein
MPRFYLSNYLLLSHIQFHLLKYLLTLFRERCSLIGGSKPCFKQGLRHLGISNLLSLENILLVELYFEIIL